MITLKRFASLALMTLLLVIQTTAQQKQGAILTAAPKKVDGFYEYDQILETFKQRGFVVISEQRRKDTDVEHYADKVAGQVRQLLKAGVLPQTITVVGASQGSYIAMLASTYLKNPDMRFVLMAGCSAEPSFLELVNLHGNVLSIYEQSDRAGSCEKYRADATGLSKYEELQLRTGMRHGFIYRPITEWIEPTIAWARGL